MEKRVVAADVCVMDLTRSPRRDTRPCVSTMKFNRTQNQK